VNNKDPKQVVMQFNECINNQDIERLADLMADNYVFIDSSDDVYARKENQVHGWASFFDRFPDYTNHFSIIDSRGNRVFVIGHSTCSHEPLDGPALWTARIENDLVAEWRVYLDSPENREKLKLPGRPD